MHTQRRLTKGGLVAALFGVTMLLAACGDDDDDAVTATTTEASDATTTTAADDTTTTAVDEVNAEFAEYCGLAREVDEQPNFPTAEQLEELRDLAPDEIAEEAQIVVAGFLEAIEGGDFTTAFDDPEVGANLEAINAFDAEECGIVEEEGTGVVNPEFADYCAIAIELSEQDSEPTLEQLEAYGAAAPDEIRAEAEVVVEAFTAAIEAGNVQAAYEDPAVAQAFGPIDEFDAENCGLPG
jgi:hypothetical protein